MSKLDQELADALKASDDAPPVAKPSAPAAPTAAPFANQNLGMLAMLLAMVGALTTFFFVGLKPAAVYAAPVDQVIASKSTFVGRKVRIEGELVPGTLEKRDQPCEYRFRIHGTAPGLDLPIRYTSCVIPDTFRDRPEGGVQVTVEGSLAQAGTFEASQVMAKCASKYDPKEHKMKSEDGKLSER